LGEEVSKNQIGEMSMGDSVYDYSAKTIDGKEKSLSEYEGKAILVVNTASK